MVRPASCCSMMSATHRISRGSEFSRTLKRGVRVSTRDLVVSVSVVPAHWPDPTSRRRDVAMVGGPWLGLIVSKSVGSAVTRHAVARRLRAAFRSVMTSCPDPETYVVIRALPSAAASDTTDLADQLRDVLTRRKVRALTASVTPSASGEASARNTSSTDRVR